jgi:integrase
VPRVYKPRYLKAIPAGAKIVQHKGKPHVRYHYRDGESVLAKVTKDGKRCLVPWRVWAVEYKDADGILQTAKGYADLPASEQLAARLEREAARQHEGMVDAFADHLRRPLAEHLADYRRELEARNNDPGYVSQTIFRVGKLLHGCNFCFIADLSASGVANWLADLRRKGRERTPLEKGKDWFTLTETGAILGIKPASVGCLVRRHRLDATGNGKARQLPLATVEALQDRLCRGASVQTANYYLRDTKSFCRWLVRDRRAPDNPLAHLEGGNAALDRRHDRRELAPAELSRLLDVARDSALRYRGLTGNDRFVLYALACGTGFRVGGLASLKPESFALNDEPPTVTLAARSNKNRKLQVQPIPPDLAALLRDYLRDKPVGQPLWQGTWSDKGAEMLRIDLEAAGIPYVIDGPDGPLYADFHALRHSYISALGRAGVELRTAQELAGHSTPVLTARYSHRRLHDLAGAVELLPRFLPKRPDKIESLLATGTEGKHAVQHVAQHAVAPHIHVHRDASASIADGKQGVAASCHNPLERKPVGASQHQPASLCISSGGWDRTSDTRLMK